MDEDPLTGGTGSIRLRVYETKTLTLLGDFDSLYVPRVGERIQLGPHLNVGDIMRHETTTHEVLTVVYQAPMCVHIEVALGSEGGYLGDAGFDDSLSEALRTKRTPRGPGVA